MAFILNKRARDARKEAVADPSPNTQQLGTSNYRVFWRIRRDRLRGSVIG
jgi:hypothetical protein